MKRIRVSEEAVLRIDKILISLIVCLGVVGCKNSSSLAVTQTPSQNASQVIPLPEADQSDSSEPVDAIVVDKNGTMQQMQYTYDPDQGGVVINNYEEVSGDGASIFFPAFEVGMLWWGGYWVDHEGYYWNGNRYAQVHDAHWNDNWNHYWHQNWNHKWDQYRNSHPQNFKGANGRQYNRTYTHHNGQSRAGHQGVRGGGHRGGGGRR